MARRASKSRAKRPPIKRKVAVKTRPKNPPKAPQRQKPKRRPGRKPASFQKKIAKSIKKSAAKLDRQAQRELDKRQRRKARQQKKEAAATRRKRGEANKLKPFHKQLTALKDAGVLPENFDVRNAKPTKANLKKVHDFADVISGRASALKLSKPSWRKHYRDQGHVVKDGFAIIENLPGQTTSVDDRGLKTTRFAGRYETTELPLGDMKLEKFLHELEFNKEWEKLKRPGERWAFRFYGNNSRRVFTNLPQMVDYLSQYETIDKALSKKSRARNRAEIINAIELVRIAKGMKAEQWTGAPNKKRDFEKQNRAYKEKMGRRYTERPKRKSNQGRWEYWKQHEPIRYRDKLRAARNRMRKLRKKRAKQKG